MGEGDVEDVALFVETTAFDQEFADSLADAIDQRGLDTTGLEPQPPVHEDLADYHVIVSLGGDVRPHLPEVPFHTVVLEWDLGPCPEGMDQERAEGLLEEMYKGIAGELQGLIETLRGGVE